MVMVRQCALGPWAKAEADPRRSATAMPLTRQRVVMHGGAGTITRQNMPPDMEKQYRETLEQALRTGHCILAKSGWRVDRGGRRGACADLQGLGAP